MKCSICEKNKDVIKFKDFNICKNCIISLRYLVENKDFLKNKIQENESSNIENSNIEKNKILYPSKIIELLNENIVGQEKAKEKLAVSIFNHLKIINEDIDLKKSNCFLIGPTASGKTEFARQIAKILDVPLAIIDSSNITASGYIGKDIDDIFISLLSAANDDIEKAEKGIIFLDEIDKIAKRLDRQGTRDIKGEAVQQNLLKIIEGDKFYIKNLDLEIDTSKILFITAGAFSDFEEFIEGNEEKSVGFFAKENQKDKSKKDIYNEDFIIQKLKNYGFIPEFLGRFSNFIILNKLNDEELKNILKLKNSELQNYIKLLKNEGFDVQIKDSFYDKIVKKIKQNEVGARGIKQEIDKVFHKILLNIDKIKDKKIILD